MSPLRGSGVGDNGDCPVVASGCAALTTGYNRGTSQCDFTLRGKSPADGEIKQMDAMV